MLVITGSVFRILLQDPCYNDKINLSYLKNTFNLQQKKR